jgi:hypothetical protein
MAAFNSTTTTTTKNKAYIREDRQDRQDRQQGDDRRRGDEEIEGRQVSANEDRQAAEDRQNCHHGYTGGKGCYLCDLNHPLRANVAGEDSTRAERLERWKCFEVSA